MGVTKRLQERFAAPLSGCKVDREAGIIFGALLCGVRSENGRSYPWGRGLTCDPSKYEGAGVNAEHSKNPGLRENIGWLRNVRFDDQGRPRADVHFLMTDPTSHKVLEAAEKKPDHYGLSHVAVCRTRMEKGTEVIESIEEVESVDVVRRPATGATFKESTHTMPTTLKTFLESVRTAKHGPRCRKWAAAKVVREMDEMPMDLPPAPPADTAEPDADDAVDAAFKAAIAAIGDQLLAASSDPAKVKELANKIKKLALAHGDINGDGKVDAADVDAADDAPADAETYESKGVQKGKALVYEAIKTAQAVGLPVDADTLDLIGSFPADRITAVAKKLAEAKPGEKPVTSGRTKTVTEDAGASKVITLDSIKLA